MTAGSHPAERSGGTRQPEMIFHAPYPLDPGATSASGIRPVRMRDAFASLGYRVHEITGTSAERARIIRELRRGIESGAVRPDFVYAESSTMPGFMTDPDHLPRHPLQDASFFGFCERRGIRVGLFYRDIYWRFPIYGETVRWPLSSAMRAMYRWELLQYRRAGIRLYLPSAGMVEQVPIVPRERMRPLPPGAELRPIPPRGAGTDLELLYVGGLGDNYRMQETVRAIAGTPGVRLTICTRENEWDRRRAEYEPLLGGGALGGSVRVVHRSGEGLRELYDAADVCVLAVEPIPYWEFASPMKLYEYLGYGKPILASTGTLAGSFVAENGVGWSLPYGSDEVRALLEGLAADRAPLGAVSRRVLEVREDHSWEARAREVARDLAH